MRWIRSFPRTIPAGRAYVVDDMERLLLDDFDYTPLGDIDEDVIVVEWDMAISREDRERFEHLAEVCRGRVLVAPYKLYHVAPEPVWAHRRFNFDTGERWLSDTDQWADYFGFGLISLPHWLVRAFLEAPALERGRPPNVLTALFNDRRLHDQTFSMWHYWRSSPDSLGHPVADIAWDVRPVHLHY